MLFLPFWASKHSVRFNDLKHKSILSKQEQPLIRDTNILGSKIVSTVYRMRTISSMAKVVTQCFWGATIDGSKQQVETSIEYRQTIDCRIKWFQRYNRVYYSTYTLHGRCWTVKSYWSITIERQWWSWSANWVREGRISASCALEDSTYPC